MLLDVVGRLLAIVVAVCCCMLYVVCCCVLYAVAVAAWCLFVVRRLLLLSCVVRCLPLPVVRWVLPVGGCALPLMFVVCCVLLADC